MYKISANTLFIGQNLVFVPECHSTNSLAQELLQKGMAHEGTLVITAKQTQGRGQRGNQWESEPNQNLTFSVILTPYFVAAAEQFSLTQAASLAVADLLALVQPGVVTIKWPNDVMINGKKVCGILIENSISKNQIAQSIVGIGLNVNQQIFSVPTATSLAIELKLALALPELLNQLMEKLEARYLQLRSGNVSTIKNDYLRLLHWRNEVHRFEANGDQLIGTITGIDSLGKLLVAEANSTRAFDLKEIKFIE